ncbi:hypothetical protein [Neglectibacter sp. CSJ-5]|uniref:hypothetical protein n=1 Tax=Neglectibacter sp. CSJ-5 TaxID=3078043 RepID=UPI0029301B47|nr:hypothetical protein [Neglectibacter sp. CSJ-5]
MKKQFAVMFCLLAIFTCLVGCSGKTEGLFPSAFVRAVGQEKADALKTLGVTEQALSGYTVDVYGKTADVQLSFDAYRGDETSAGKLNYAELTVPCTPNDDGFSYMRTCYDELEKALGEPFTTDVNMDSASAEDGADALFAALQKDAGGENICALQYQWRGLGENESLLYLYYYPNENGTARVKLTFLPQSRAQIP